MILRNPHLAKLSKNYLFLEIRKRKEAYLKQNPNAKLISLGIGDTPRPLTQKTVKALMQACVDQGCKETYVGYGPEQGISSLREAISEFFYDTKISSDEIFISDGAKCDTARLQTLLGSQHTIAMQDPSYPVYLDGSLLQGSKHLIYLPCTCENDFFPDCSSVPEHSVVYICSPNNPTGVAYTKEQLQSLVNTALKKNLLIIFDAAYSAFIQGRDHPKSIYEISGAEKVAIELNSFSKLAGFTGVRLGWSVVPKALKYSDGSSIHEDWLRVVSTAFNGASIISQKGALALLTKEGFEEAQENLNLYLENAALLKETFEKMGFTVFGAHHSPYLWVQTDQSSWQMFDFLLENAHIICTPGSGFGPSGEGYIRLSAFAEKKSIELACERLSKLVLSKNRVGV